MPELPEVEIIRRGLEGRLLGQRIVAVEDRGAKMRGGQGTMALAELADQHVVRIERHGKFLLLRTAEGCSCVVHLGMTGKLLFAEPGEAERKHTHVVFHFESFEVRFVDPRRFGGVRAYSGEVPDVAHYGPDAMSKTWTAEHLAAQLAASRAPLKAFLLDQTKVAGVGNIYACEALWRAGLSPRRKACNTPRTKVPRLHAAVREVLAASIAAGGTSFNDYVDSIGQQGSFLFSVAVFQREGLACPECGTAIRRLVQSGRSTFYCPTCQR